jgi:hypothetical protein
MYRNPTDETSEKEKVSTAIDSWLSGWLSPSPTTNQGTASIGFQRWFHFKEAFSPSFVQDVINKQSRPINSICDPFSGSGTTALTAQFLGITPTIIEVNPFLADLTETKLSSLDAAHLLHTKRSVINQAKGFRDEKLLEMYALPPTFIEPGVRNRWLFNRDVAIKILSYRKAIDQIQDAELRRASKVALGSVLVTISNAVVNGKGRRYRSGWESRPDGNVDDLFDGAFSKIIEDAPLAARKATTAYKLHRGDARQKILEIEDEIDLALFSPPYPNSFDYTDVYNIELWILGYLTSFKENRTLREQTLRSHVQISRDLSFSTESATLTNIYKKLSDKRDDLWDQRIPEMVGAYFADLLAIISGIEKKLHKAGRIELVVGDSKYLGIHLPVPLILAEIVPTLGLKVLSQHTVRSMRSSAQQGGVLSLPESLVTIGR